MATRSKTTAPKAVSTSGSTTGTATVNKRSVIIHKTEKPIENLSGELAKIEETIQELCGLMAQLPESRHIGVGGKPVPTEKQKQVSNELKAARKRSAVVMSTIARSANENLSGLLGKMEETIQELSRLLAGLPESRHIGVAGKLIPTIAGQVIGQELDFARERAEQINQIISNA